MRKTTLTYGLIALLALWTLIAYATRAQAQMVGHVGDVVPMAHINYCESKESALALANAFKANGQDAARAYFAQHDECEDDYMGFTVMAVVGTFEGDFNGQKRVMTIAEILLDESGDHKTVWMVTFVRIEAKDTPS